MNIIDLILDLAKKSGIPESHEQIVALAQKKELAEIALPEELEKSFGSSLISLKDAKNNHPEIRNHYFPLALNPLDKHIEKMVDEYGLDADARASILNETSTYKRLPLLINTIKETEGKKQTTDKEKAATWQKQIDELHAQLRNVAAERENDKKAHEQQLFNYRLDYTKDTLLGGYKTTFDELDHDVRNQTLRNLLNKNLQDNNAEIVFDEGGSPILRKKDGSNFYTDNNQQLNLQQFAEMVLSKSKVLKTNQNSQSPDGKQTNPQGQQQPQGGAGGNTNAQQSVFAANAEAIKSFNQPHAVA